MGIERLEFSGVHTETYGTGYHQEVMSDGYFVHCSWIPGMKTIASDCADGLYCALAVVVVVNYKVHRQVR